MGSPRTAVALYVALALHLVVALLIALAPRPQRPPGPGQGMGLGLQLSGTDSVLAQAMSNDGRLAPAANRSDRPATIGDLPLPTGERPTILSPANSDLADEVRRPASTNHFPRGSTDRLAVRDQAAGPSAHGGGSRRGGGGKDHYLARLRLHLSAFRRQLPPGIAPGEAEVVFVVSAEGRLASLALLRSSGDPALDAEALDLLRRSQPLPPSPEARALQLVVPILIE